MSQDAEVLACTHPKACQSWPEPYPAPDSPTVFCRWCAEIDRLEDEVLVLQAQLDAANEQLHRARGVRPICADGVDVEPYLLASRALRRKLRDLITDRASDRVALDRARWATSLMEPVLRHWERVIPRGEDLIQYLDIIVKGVDPRINTGDLRFAIGETIRSLRQILRQDG